jgi:hypothetical protein
MFTFQRLKNHRQLTMKHHLMLYTICKYDVLITSKLYVVKYIYVQQFVTQTV